MNRETNGRSNFKPNRITTWVLVLVVITVVTAIIALTIILFINGENTKLIIGENTEPNSISIYQDERGITVSIHNEKCIIAEATLGTESFRAWYACQPLFTPTFTPTPLPTSTPTLMPAPTPTFKSPTYCKLKVDSSYEEFSLTLCQKICYSDNISRYGKSAKITLYKNVQDMDFPNNRNVILVFDIDSGSEEGVKSKTPKQLINTSCKVDQLFNIVGRIEVILPESERESILVYSAFPPDCIFEETRPIVSKNLELIGNFSCPSE